MPARKRQQPDSASPPPPSASSTGRRRSGRLSSSAQKSKYFQEDTNDDDEDQLVAGGGGVGRPAKRVKAPSSPVKSTPRGRKAKVGLDDDDDDDEVYREDEDEEEDEDEDVEDGDEYDDGDDKAKKPVHGRRRSQQNGRKPKHQSDDDDDDAGPKVTFTPLPKMRDDGGVAYEDGRLHKNTMLFLRDLKANNKRSWLKMNDKEYRRSLKDWESFVESFTQRIIKADETVPELPAKDVIFRIYRDVRFSKDPTPYKPHFSAAWSRTGRKGPYACYYIHCEPGGVFVGGGLWHPEADHVQKLRASIDERPRRWRRALMEPAFVRTFLPKAKVGDERSIIKAFAVANEENALKTKPKGFLAEHRDIELLKLRNYTVGKKIPDSWLTDKDAQDKLGETIEAMVGFVTFLNSIVMPDPGVDEDSNDDEE